jgi:methanogenic corrinoid protein MtbC1
MDSRSEPTLNIAAVERETGLSKDVLRKWELRYGFPAPRRDSQGERAYPADQVNRLRLIKRLMDSGLRPSKLVNLDDGRLADLGRTRTEPPPAGTGDVAASVGLGLLREGNPDALRQRLRLAQLDLGIEHFVLDTLVPLNAAVGDAWARGELDIHEEHLYTEAVKWLLRDAAEHLNDPGGRPRVLLTTLPGEQHGLGVLMVATLLSLRGAYCISLGTQTPVQEIARAVRAHAADVVALSFSAAYPRRGVRPALEELSATLGGSAEIWAGGAGAGHNIEKDPGIRFLTTLPQAMEGLNVWRTLHGG